MPDRRTPTAAERSEALVQSAAERAVGLALAGSERSQADAVARALRDERVDRDLRDHQLHLDAINGSQARLATAVEGVKEGQAKLIAQQERQVTANEAVAEALEAQGRRRLNRWERAGAIAGVFAAYGGIVATIFAATS